MYLATEKKCPYCNADLLKEPKRGSECDKCGKTFHVVGRPSDKKKVVTTEEEFQVFNFRKDLKSLYLDNPKEFERALESAQKGLQSKFGHEPKEKDVLWRLANDIIVQKMKSDLVNLPQVYLVMALFLHNIGKSNFEMLKAYHKVTLEIFKRQNFKRVSIVSSSCCVSCQKMNNKKIEIANALKEMPLPSKNCTYKINAKAPDSWCVCSYIIAD